MNAEAVTTNVDTELKRKLLEYAEVLEQSVKTGAEFAADKIPVVVQEYVTFHFWLSLAGVATGVLLMAAAFVGARMICKGMTREDETGMAIGTGMVVFGLGIGPIITLHNVPHLMKVCLAPNVFILEKIADLIK